MKSETIPEPDNVDLLLGRGTLGRRHLQGVKVVDGGNVYLNNHKRDVIDGKLTEELHLFDTLFLDLALALLHL